MSLVCHIVKIRICLSLSQLEVLPKKHKTVWGKMEQEKRTRADNRVQEEIQEDVRRWGRLDDKLNVISKTPKERRFIPVALLPLAPTSADREADTPPLPFSSS